MNACCQPIEMDHVTKQTTTLQSWLEMLFTYRSFLNQTFILTGILFNYLCQFSHNQSQFFCSLCVRMEAKEAAKKKILCLHGFRTSGSFLRKQISKWDPSIFAHFDMDFPDGIFPAGGKSDIEGIFPPPYFEWFQFDKEFTEYTNLDECIDYLCDYITSKGPFHGLLGFSQGATLSALLLGYQAQGKILKEHPPIELFVSISGSKFRAASICEVAYKDPINVKSVHFIGEKDWLKLPSEELASAFVNPLIIRHPQGHTVPRLDEEAVKKLGNWTMGFVLLQTIGNAASVEIEHENTKNGGDSKTEEKSEREICEVKAAAEMAL